MTKTLEEMIAVMVAAKEGKQIQFRSILTPPSDWKNNDNPQWGWNEFDYRVKPEPPQPKYVPFTFEDAKQLIGLKAERLNHNAIGLINAIGINGVCVGLSSLISYEELMTNYVFFPSGEPCGKIVEE